MAKRFRLGISRAISSTLKSCRSKDPSILPQDPVPSFSALKIHSPINPSPPHFKWHKDDDRNWHVVATIYDTAAPRRKISVSSSSTPPPETRRRGNRNKKKINVPSRLRLSTSSADSGWFSNEEEEIEMLVSPSICSFSTDSSSEINRSSKLRPIREDEPPPVRRRSGCRKRTSSKRTRRRASPHTPAEEVEAETPARLSVLKRLIPCSVEGKVRESYAIVKKSEDPYEDFKNSMVDMIVEKQIFDREDLEQLLQCFLSLNSRHYHAVIVEAFSEICDAIFAAAAATAKMPPSDGVHQNPRRISSRLSF